jgi:hypothetical protein
MVEINGSTGFDVKRGRCGVCRRAKRAYKPHDSPSFHALDYQLIPGLMT